MVFPLAIYLTVLQETPTCIHFCLLPNQFIFHIYECRSSELFHIKIFCMHTVWNILITSVSRLLDMYPNLSLLRQGIQDNSYICFLLIFLLRVMVSYASQKLKTGMFLLTLNEYRNVLQSYYIYYTDMLRI